MKHSYLSDCPELLATLGEFSSVSVPDREVTETVSGILEEVRLRGDEALLEKTLLYDGASLSIADITVPSREIIDAQSMLKESERTAISEAISNVFFTPVKIFKKGMLLD